MLSLDVTASADPPARTRVRVGRGVLREIEREIEGARSVLVVMDQKLPLVQSPAESSRHEVAVVVSKIAAEESRKTIASCEELWNDWIAAGAGRDSIVVAIGGGLVSDVAGFAAACFHRGVPWIVVPTTTLSFADAALGGKTAVNTREGKNLIGAIHHPRAVLGDVSTLETLPAEAFAEGFAEVVKAAAIGDAALLQDVEAEAGRVRTRDLDAATPLLFAALKVKADVVSADAREESRREILNFGHTVAHAIEHASAHAVSHGRAVAAGIVAEGLVAERLGRLPPGTARRLADACEAVGVSWRLSAAPSKESLVSAMRRDKKVRAGEVRVALPDGLGRHSASPGTTIDPNELAALVGVEP